MVTHNITIDVTNPENYYTGLKFKQFDKGIDSLNISLISGTSNFVTSSYDALSVRIIRSDGKVFDNIIWRKNDSGSILSGSTINYPIGYFETFCAGSCGLEFSFITFDENDSSKISKHLTLPRILFDIYASISSYGVIEKRSMDLFQALLEDVKKIQAAVTYEGFEENYEVIKKAVILENGGELDGKTIIGRVQAEKARAEAERLRDEAENGKEVNGQIVGGRNKAEYFREENEGERILAEIERNYNEFGELDENGVPKRDENGVPIGRYWAEAERQTAEIGRVEAEKTRAIAELGRSAMIEARHFDSYEEAYEFIDSIRNREQKIYKISYVGTAEEPEFIEWVICSYNNNPSTPYFQTLIGIFGIQTRQFTEWDNGEHIQKWSAWQTIVDESMLESRIQSFADEFTIDVDQSYNPLSENAQSGKAVAEAIANLVNGSPEALDTLNELAKALGNDENFSATVMGAIGEKSDLTYVDRKFENFAEEFRTADKLRITQWRRNRFYLTGEYVFAALSNGNAAIMEVTAPILVRGSDTPPDALPDFETNFKIIYTFGDYAVDQRYNAKSENAQSGKAVAEAISTIVNASPDGGYVIIDQSYNALSENAQSGKAVAEAIANLVNGSPEALDTLHELANALGNDENFSATVMEKIGKKADTASLEEAKSDIACILDGRTTVPKASSDRLGNDIVLHYATKQELENTVLNVERNIEASYATKEEVTTQIGDIETALDGIITIQNGILGVGVNE